MKKNSFKFPAIWPGYALALLALICSVATAIPRPRISHEIQPPTGGHEIVFILLFLLRLTGFVYWCVCLYKMHKTILSMADNHYPISPARAVGFGFIPFYNIYWMFKWPSEVINFVNARDTSRKLNRWLPGIFMAMSALVGLLNEGLWLFIIFGVLSHLVRALKRSLVTQPEPAPYKDQTTRLSTIVVIAIMCFGGLFVLLGILVSIALPRLAGARHAAIANKCRANLKQLDAAKHFRTQVTGEDWGEVPLDWPDLEPYIAGEKPTCPAGGTYTVKPRYDTFPTCSIGDNGTEWTGDDHILRIAMPPDFR